METTREISLRVDRKVRRYMEENETTYTEALKQVLKADGTLAAQYAGCEAVKPPASVSGHVGLQKAAGEEINRLVLKYMSEQEDACSYSEGLQAVLTARPDLARRYNNE